MMRTTQIFFLLGLLLPLCAVVTSNSIKNPKKGYQKPGQCPPERHYNMDSKITHKICDSDSRCPNDMKCCPDNGDMMCKPPAYEKQGQCPTFEQKSASMSNDNCTSDSECPSNWKCCFKYGGKTCSPTLSDLGKPNTGIEARNRFCQQEAVYNCEKRERYTCDEVSCIDGYKCCPYICRVGCHLSLSERDGKCPVNPGCPTGDKNKSCTTDHDCTTFHKCCSTSCGQKCLRATDIKLNIRNR